MVGFQLRSNRVVALVKAEKTNAVKLMEVALENCHYCTPLTV